MLRRTIRNAWYSLKNAWINSVGCVIRHNVLEIASTAEVHTMFLGSDVVSYAELRVSSHMSSRKPQLLQMVISTSDVFRDTIFISQCRWKWFPWFSKENMFLIFSDVWYRHAVLEVVRWKGSDWQSSVLQKIHDLPLSVVRYRHILWQNPHRSVEKIGVAGNGLACAEEVRDSLVLQKMHDLTLPVVWYRHKDLEGVSPGEVQRHPCFWAEVRLGVPTGVQPTTRVPERISEVFTDLSHVGNRQQFCENMFQKALQNAVAFWSVLLLEGSPSSMPFSHQNSKRMALFFYWFPQTAVRWQSCTSAALSRDKRGRVWQSSKTHDLSGKGVISNHYWCCQPFNVCCLHCSELVRFFGKLQSHDLVARERCSCPVMGLFLAVQGTVCF